MNIILSCVLNIVATMGFLWIVGGMFIMLKRIDFFASFGDIDPTRVIIWILTILIIWRIWA